MTKPNVHEGDKRQSDEGDPNETEHDPQSDMDTTRPYRNRNENNPHKNQAKCHRHAPRVPYGQK